MKIESVQKQANNAWKAVKEAQTFLENVEKRCEVIDIDSSAQPTAANADY